MPLWVRRSWSHAFMYLLSKKREEEQENEVKEPPRHYEGDDKYNFFKDV